MIHIYGRRLADMDAFVLETLLTSGWRRGGNVFWTVEDAEQEGKRLIKRKTAKAYRILPAKIDAVAIAESSAREARA
jgi:hypothetical protein